MSMRERHGPDGGGELAAPARLLAEGRAAEAMMAVEMAIARRPDDRKAKALRQAIMATVEAMDPGLAMLDLAAALHPDRPEAHYQLGHGYVRFDRPADAERCFKRALELEPQSAEIHASLAALYLGAGVAAGAEHHARRALELEGGHAVASQTLASVLEARGERQAAQALLDQAYRRKSLFLEPAQDPQLRVLVLSTIGAGNVPYRYVMPSQSYTRLVWYMEYAREAQTPAPDQYDLVFNAIGDADLAEPSTDAVARFVADCPKPVLNLPDQVMRTRRDRVPALLGDLPDVLAPEAVRLDAALLEREGFEVLARTRGVEAPVLVRPIGSHGGQGLALAADSRLLAQLTPAAGLDHYLTRYVDSRAADGLYRKYRVLFVDREPYPYHLAICDHWLVHYDSSGMGDFAERRAEEARYLADPEAAIGARAAAAVRAIGQALDLDYCGMDFGVLPDGRLLVFEANPTMLAHPEDPAGPFAYKNPFVAAITDAFQAHLGRLVSVSVATPQPRWSIGV